MSLARDLKERILKECGIETLEAKVAALTAKADAAEARLAVAEARLATIPREDPIFEKRISALEASLGVYEAEGELR